MRAVGERGAGTEAGPYDHRGPLPAGRRGGPWWGTPGRRGGPLRPPVGWWAAATLLLAMAAPAAVPANADAAAPPFRLHDVAAEAGIEWVNVSGAMTPPRRTILEENGNGGCLFDYDGDGDLDLFLVNGGDLEVLAGRRPPLANALYRNDGGWRFVEVTAAAGVGAGPAWGMGCTVGDVDGDGLPDLYLTGYGANVLYRNQGDGTFRDVTAESGVGDPGWSHSAAFGDFDGDGDLDLYVTNNLEFSLDRVPAEPCQWRGVAVACGPVGWEPQPDRLFVNDGAGRFHDGSLAAGIHAPEPQFGLGVALADYDDDGRLDIAVANDSGPNFLFRNLGGGRFEEVAWEVGLATQREGRFQAGMGIDWGDADGDGTPDLVVTNFAFDHDTLYLQQPGGLFEDASYPSGLGGAGYREMSWGVRFVDLDHDGDLDLYVANGHIYPEVDAAGEETLRQADHLLLNDGAGKLTPAPERIVRSRGPACSRGVAAGDLDGDGDVDLLVVEAGEVPTLLRNEAGEAAGSWLQVALLGRGPSDGEGTRGLVTVAGRTQRREATRSGSYLSASDVRLHFGVGTAAAIERLELRWPDGRSQRFVGLPARRVLVVPQPGPARAGAEAGPYDHPL
ncbi:MAG TPA: CRTAC1 family protein [Thermoanaerobaculia bacterium]|nr:CRTAC1 family protein [Thermoanaerobaculia bacterium]